MAYRHRIADDILATALEAVGGVVIEGPRASGKTETARHASRSELRLDLPDARQLLAVSPPLALEGAAPRLIDEWQLAPEIWNYVRRAIDDRATKGQFILTGSAMPRDDPSRHPGAGRFVRVRMRPMTLFETGHSTGTISFAEVMQASEVSAADPGLTVVDLAERIVIGGWPANLGLGSRQSQQALVGYLEDVYTVDVPRLDGVRRDPRGLRRLMASLARNVATEVPIEALAADTSGQDGGYVTDTIRAYLDAFERLMVTEDLPAWRPSIRSRARLRASPVRHLVDPSLATAALNAAPARLLKDLRWMGFLYESLVVRDLRVFAAPVNGRLFHYRDSNGLEVDVIVELSNGAWAGFEVKLGAAPIVVDQAAASLLKLAETVTEPPVALAVITGTGYGYRRRDGVTVMPIGALGP